MHLSNTRISTLGSTVASVLIATLAICTWGFWSIIENINRSADWERQQAIAAHKIELASDIYRTMGYVGFIHHFKNLVLRQDMKYYEWAQTSAQASRVAIEAYAELATEDEKAQLEVIRSTLETYANKLPLIPELIESGVTTASLDKLVKVDDTPALMAIDALIEAERKAAQAAAEGITASAQKTASVIRHMVFWMSLMIGLSILLSLYGIRRVVGGIGAMTDVFRKISKGEPVESIPNQGKSNELGDLADAADAFRKALQDSQANEAYLQATQNAVVDGLVIIDTSGIVRFFNGAAETIFGYPRDEVIGQNIKMLMPEPEASNHDAYLQRYLETGVKQVIGIVRKVTARRKNGDLFNLELSVAEAKTDNEHVYVGLARDITERVEMQRQLEMRNSELSRLNADLKTNMEALAEAQGQVVQAEKMASLGRVIAGTAHELNTPLGIAVTSSSIVRDELLHIAGNAEKNKLKNDELQSRLSRSREALDLVESCLSRASKLVTTLKALSPHERQDRIQALSFPDCLRDIMTSMEPELKSAGVSLRIESEGELVIASYLLTLADVIQVLASNAICHAFEDQQDRQLTLLARPISPNRIEIVVSDNGIGIPEAMLPSIFEPFSTLKKAQGHHGLGLYAVHNLVISRLKGAISVASSHPGGGTCFTLSLPDLKKDASPQPD